MNLQLTDKTALVSGSTKGIGFAIATGLAREGARVIVNGRSEKAVVEARKQINQTVPNARIETFAGDLSTAAATETLLQRFPHVDILVNNLGIFEPKPFDQIPDEDWRRFFEVNVLSGMMPPLMVAVTLEPTRKAPRNSKTEARQIAWRSVSVPAPTTVPIPLATSLAPMFQAL